MLVRIGTADREALDAMAFRHISEALDGVLRGLELREAGCPEGAGGTRPIAHQGEGPERNSRKKSGGATKLNPTQLPPLWKTPQGGKARLGGLRLVSSKCMDRASPTRRPTVARSIHLRLVWDAGHDTAPKARRRCKITSAAATSVIPAMKP